MEHREKLEKEKLRQERESSGGCTTAADNASGISEDKGKNGFKVTAIPNPKSKQMVRFSKFLVK